MRWECKAGRKLRSSQLETAGPAHSVRLIRERDQVTADGQDLAFVRVEVVDEHGQLRADADHSIEYELKGPGSIIAVGSGDLTSREGYQANPRKTYQGRALVVLRTTHQPGIMTLTARAAGLEPATVEVNSHAAQD